MYMNIQEKLLKIQLELKAPKSQYNSFGKYKYRNAEDILEAVKPLCQAAGAFLILSDEIVNIGERYYVKATAKLCDTQVTNNVMQYIETIAYAREEEDKKGMDGSQVTGASSSYARKYALNGLFAIDDTKDSDTTNTGDKGKETVKADDKKAGEPQQMNIPLTLSDAENMLLSIGEDEIALKNLSLGQLERLLKNEDYKKYHEAVTLILESKANGN